MVPGGARWRSSRAFLSVLGVEPGKVGACRNQTELLPYLRNADPENAWCVGINSSSPGGRSLYFCSEINHDLDTPSQRPEYDRYGGPVLTWHAPEPNQGYGHPADVLKAAADASRRPVMELGEDGHEKRSECYGHGVRYH